MYFLGVDIGGTMTKAGLYTAKGEEIQVVEKESDALTPNPGWVERDMPLFWQSVCFCIKNCIKKANIEASKIKAVGFSAHGKGLYLIDNNGDPVRNGIISNDTRATNIVQDWITRGIDKKTYPAGRQQLWTGHPVSLLAWLKENEAENYAKIDTVFMAHDYIRFKLSGAKFAEITNISGSNAYNNQNSCYDEMMLDAFGIKESIAFFPPTIGSLEQAGSVSKQAAQECGLIEGTPIFGGFFDVVAAAVSASLMDETTLNIVAGTWAITTRITHTIEDHDYPYIWGKYCLNGSYFVHEGSPTSASNLQWFLDQIMSKDKETNKADLYEQCNQWVDELLDQNEDLFFLPYLFGSNISLDLKAGFFGLQAHHERKHLIKAIYEGIVFSYLIHHERIINGAPIITKIRFTGGPTRSTVWMQLFCDATGLPLEVIDLEQSGCSAAAFCGIAGSKIYASVEEAMEKMSPPVTCYQPNEKRHARLKKQYQKYLCVAQGMDKISKEIKAMS